MPVGFGQMFETLDTSPADRTFAAALKGLSHVVFGRVVVKGDIFPDVDVAARQHLPSSNDGVGFATVIHEPPEVAVEDFLQGVPDAQINVLILTDLNRVT